MAPSTLHQSVINAINPHRVHPQQAYLSVRARPLLPGTPARCRIGPGALSVRVPSRAARAWRHLMCARAPPRRRINGRQGQRQQQEEQADGRGWYGKLKTHVRDVAFRTRDFRSCGTPCSPARRCVARAPLHSCSHALALLYSAGGCLPGLASNSRVGAWQLHRLSLSGGRSTQHVEARCTARDSTSVWLRHAQPCGVLVAHSTARPHPIQLPPTRSPWKPSDRRFSLRGKQS